MVPGLLQTAEYARVQRQEILYRPDKRFHFVPRRESARLIQQIRSELADA